MDSGATPASSADLAHWRLLTRAAEADLLLERAQTKDPAAIVWTHPIPEPWRKPMADGIFSPEERARWAAFPSERRRDSFLFGRWTAKLALQRLTAVPDLRSLVIGSGVFGQPVVDLRTEDSQKGETRGPWNVSISHCSLASVAVAAPLGHPVGIDVERMTDLSHVDLQSHIESAEWELTREIEFLPCEKASVFWTSKEALSKVLRCGFTVPLALLRIDAIDCLAPRCFAVHFANFLQYRCLTWLMEDAALSVVLPARTELHGMDSLWKG